MSERQTTGEFINYRIGERSGKTYNKVQEMAKEIVRLEQENKEWFDIADNILRATNKYGEISIGEVVDYIDKLQKELEQQKKSHNKLFNGYNDRVQEIIELEKENEKLKDIKNKAVGYINCCKTSLGNYLLSPSEVECLLDILKEGDIE